MSNRRRAFEDKITNPNFRRKINVNNTGSIISKNDNPYEDYNNQKISSLSKNPNAYNDPFGTNKKKLEREKETPVQKTNKIILTKLKQARQTGTIDISNLKLTIIPQEVFDPNVDIEGVNWWEMVDINKLDASNNLLSENSFNEEEHSLSLLSYLISLRFSNNKFNSIPNSLYKLSNLKLLDLSGNSITDINENLLKGLSSLVELDLSKNKLKGIPESIQFLSYLEVLRVSNNQLLSIPDGLGALTRLKKLYLNENSLQFLPPNLFSRMVGLEEIYLYKNRLENICDNKSSIFDNMKHLKFLDIHSNYLTIFNIFTEMPILDSLLLSYNQIQYIKGLDKCYNITNLDLNNNKITEFPSDILKLKKLTTLNLQNNDLNSIPNTLGLMNNLVRLNIEGNPLKRLVGKMRNCSTEELKNYLKTRITDADLENTTMTKEDLYDINDNNNMNHILHNVFNNGLVMKEMNIKSIPVEEMQNSIQKNMLNKIDFSVNQINDITNLTYVLNRIESISELNLSQNLIDKFPLIILSLPNLSTLNLSKNKLKKFPYDEFTSTNLNDVRSSLVNLDLSFNYIDTFPEIIGLFQNISNINLASNTIYFVDNLLNMKLLELDTLNLSDNKIEKLPNKLYKNMPKIKTFLMSNNNLRDIPSDICMMKSLSNVNFYGNQIRRLRSDALTSATALLNYLRKIHVFDDEDKMNDNNNFSNNNNINNNNFQQNQMGGNNNNFNNNFGGNNSRQKSGYKNMDQPSYHNTHGYENQNQINNSYGNNNYNRGGYNNQMNNNNFNNYNDNNFGRQSNQKMNNNQFNNYNNNNIYGQGNNQNNQQFNNNMNPSGSSNKRTLDDINKDIASLEEEMSVPTLPQYQKAALRKKYHALLVERSKFLK